jgi:predicted metal-dependent phosphoesterase TrpH
MKIQLHLHTSLYSSCAKAAPERLMEKLIETGFDAVFITEHNAVWRDWEVERLQERYPDIKIYPGVEITVGQQSFQHLLVLGTVDPAFLKMRGEAEILDEARARGHLTVLAHPFRWPDGHDMIDRGNYPDAIEYRTCNHGPEEGQQSLDLAQRLDLPVVNSGDVHSLEMINSFWIETEWEIFSPDDIREIIQEGAYRNCMLEGAAVPPRPHLD